MKVENTLSRSTKYLFHPYLYHTFRWHPPLGQAKSKNMLVSRV